VIAIADLSYLFTWCRYFGTTSIGMAGSVPSHIWGAFLNRDQRHRAMFAFRNEAQIVSRVSRMCGSCEDEQSGCLEGEKGMSHKDGFGKKTS
jgi:hypothetical protein